MCPRGPLTPPPRLLGVFEQLDPVLQGLDADMKVAGSEEDEQGLKKQIKSREDALLPMYLQVSEKFSRLVV